ncbi:biotin--protein ligase isoform X2 [Ascaphus truei]|uniref:biotin--protein ligase isoform X2 n=1 Tax=Ascaphus truei TaxID=8439 RepID=UPI003F5ACFDE
MLITLCYVYMWLRFRSCYALLIRSSVRRFHRSSSFTFCTVSSQGQGKKKRGLTQVSGEDKVCLTLGNKVFLIEGSQLFEDLNKWRLLLGSSCDSHLGAEQIAFITESLSLPSETLSAASGSSRKLLNLSEYCLPLALCPGDSSKLLAEASVDNFSELGIAFMEDRLRMDNGSLPQRITSVHLNELSLEDKEAVTQDADLTTAASTTTPQLHLICSETDKAIMGVTESTQGSSPKGSNGYPQAIEDTVPREKEGAIGDHHHHLHLSSCHECLELETRTIESVRFASAENIPDLPDDFSSLEDNPVESCWVKEHTRLNETGKPPNVLVYVGSTPSDRVHQVKSVLRQCFDSDRYVIYPLPDDQVHKAPWMDNSLLLVIAAEDPISADVHDQFMTYLSKGGKMLGLSSSFTFGSVTIRNKCELTGTVQVMVFDRPNCDTMSFDVMASGRVFEEQSCEKYNQVEPWGYLNSDSKDLMIVHQTYGDNGGEAVLCQAMHPAAVQWLKTRTNKEGLIISSKLSLQVCPSLQPGMDISPCLAPLITEAGSISSEDFSLETYRKNLHTEKLGKVVLFAEVTTTTFDLLEGLMFHEPKEMGLIAIAARQTQGKGRGGNAWLSPKGCALITLHVSIPLSSQLGQRIAFVQHLMSLAVVESVRSIPGYEDIDLRVKWPNDIYYSDLMKLGGVLVNSTLMGNTFHILIGCGFNVNNSHPTICINDLIMEQNKKYKTNIEPLRVDYLIARAVTTLEKLINAFQKDGPNGVLPVYYKYWVHSGRQVRLGSEEGPLAWIVGVDDSGFLQVLQEGKDIVTVHPDGNSFDMLRNLIIPKDFPK